MVSSLLPLPLLKRRLLGQLPERRHAFDDAVAYEAVILEARPVLHGRLEPLVEEGLTTLICR